MNKIEKKSKDTKCALEGKSRREPKFMKSNVPGKYFPLTIVITF